MKFQKFRLFYLACGFAVLFCTTACETAQISGLLSAVYTESRSPFTNEEAVAALKDALFAGAGSAADVLSAENGYFADSALKLQLPPEAAIMVDTIGKIPGGQTLLDDVVLRLNRSAESAAAEVVPIFKAVISDMSVADGIAIVCGAQDAATLYLREKTYDSLYSLYEPRIAAVLTKPLVFGVSAQSAWVKLTETYNNMAVVPNKTAALLDKPLPMPPVTADLAAYATARALDGLFVKIAEEEALIRANPLDYASAMIRKVFVAVQKTAVR